MSGLKTLQSEIILKITGSPATDDKFDEVWENLTKLELVPGRTVQVGHKVVSINDRIKTLKNQPLFAYVDDTDYLDILKKFSKALDKINLDSSQLYTKQTMMTEPVTLYHKKSQQELNHENHLRNVKNGTYDEKKRKRDLEKDKRKTKKTTVVVNPQKSSNQTSSKGNTLEELEQDLTNALDE